LAVGEKETWMLPEKVLEKKPKKHRKKAPRKLHWGKKNQNHEDLIV